MLTFFNNTKLFQRKSTAIFSVFNKMAKRLDKLNQQIQGRINMNEDKVLKLQKENDDLKVVMSRDEKMISKLNSFLD